MALALSDAARIRVGTIPQVQATLPADTPATVIAKGQAVKIGPNGGWVVTTDATTCYGVAVGESQGDIGITAIRRGYIDGFDLSGEAYGSSVGPGAGGIVDEAAIGLGYVMPAWAQTLGSPASKVLFVDCALPMGTP